MTDMRSFIDLELVPMLGDFADDFDVDAIANEVTDFDPVHGIVWRDDIDDETLNAIIQKHDISGDE